MSDIDRETENGRRDHEAVPLHELTAAEHCQLDPFRDDPTAKVSSGAGLVAVAVSTKGENLA